LSSAGVGGVNPSRLKYVVSSFLGLVGCGSEAGMVTVLPFSRSQKPVRELCVN
jgi:hypothetical protein